LSQLPTTKTIPNKDYISFLDRVTHTSIHGAKNPRLTLAGKVTNLLFDHFLSGLTRYWLNWKASKALSLGWLISEFVMESHDRSQIDLKCADMW